MKEFWKSWKFWAVVAAVILVIVGVVLYFTVPQFKVMWLETISYIALFICGWLIGRYVQ